MSDAELHDRLARYFAGELTNDEAETLLAWCRENAEARAEFVEHVRFEREIRWLLQSGIEAGDVFERELIHRLRADSVEGASFVAGVVAKVAQPASRVVRRPRVVQPGTNWVNALALAACLVAAAIFGFKYLATRPAEMPSRRSVAVLTRASAAIWQSGSHAIGEALPGGRLELKSGAVEVEFTRGARVVLEGPAEFEIASDNAGYLRHGKLRAEVPPPAHGFALTGPGFSAVDLGTEFGCSVPETGVAEVHVYLGEVRVKAGAASQDQVLEAKQAVQLDGAAVRATPFRPELFLSESDLVERMRAEAGDRLAAWRVASKALDAHPSALFHFDFEQVANGNRSLPISLPGGAASIVGCDAVEGRWPGKGALGFVRPDDRLRLSVPGSFTALTLLAWVRVDDLQGKSSLLMSDEAQPGEVHWYLYGDGSLIFGVNTLASGENGWSMARTEPVLRRELFGTWVFVAVTFDQSTGTVTHYYNGLPVQSETLPVQVPMRLGTCEIGNWGARPDDPKWSRLKLPARDLVRNFHGRVDEFAALRTALPAADILKIYQTGRPGL